MAKKKQNNTVKWNLINAALAGGLVFLGSLADGVFSWEGVYVALIAGGIVTVTKFKNYWESSRGSANLFNFV